MLSVTGQIIALDDCSRRTSRIIVLWETGQIVTLVDCFRTTSGVNVLSVTGQLIALVHCPRRTSGINVRMLPPTTTGTRNYQQETWERSFENTCTPGAISIGLSGTQGWRIHLSGCLSRLGCAYFRRRLTKFLLKTTICASVLLKFHVGLVRQCDECN